VPAAITTLRGTLATDLTNAGVWSVFAFPPATLIANAVVITPGDPYIVPTNNDRTTIAPLANFKILITKPALDNQGNLAGMEDYIIAVVTKLAASTLDLNISSVSAPQIVAVQSGDLLVSEITVSILTTWS
jgi:dihydroorotate dehydrogenase